MRFSVLLVILSAITFRCDFFVTASSPRDFVIDVDDILSEDFMPGTLLMLENPSKKGKGFNESVDGTFDGTMDSEVADGSFVNAMELMEFHRSKMNEFLCRSYVAEEIINDMTMSRMKRRMGVAPPDLKSKTSKMQLSIRNNLLQDEGSSSYKDWLSKSTTLEDIYRHYDRSSKVEQRQEGAEEDKDDEVNEEYDAHIAGLGYHAPAPPQSPSKVGHSGGGNNYYPPPPMGLGGYPPYPPQHQGGGHANMMMGSSGHGYSSYPPGGGHSSYGGYGSSGTSGNGGGGGYDTNAQEEHVIHEPPKYHIIHHEESHSSGGGKEHDLSDLFDIALTALAFLAFKMFLIHIIMCITMAHNNTMTTAMPMMMPMTMTGTGDGGMGMTGTGTGSTGGGAGGGTGTGGGTGDGGTGGGGEGMTPGDGDGTTGNGNTPTGDGGGTTGNGNTPTGDGGGTTGNGNTPTGDGMLPTGGDEDSSSDGGSTGTGDGGDGSRDTLKFRFRGKRDTKPTSLINELARRVLTSIDASLVVNEDDGNCLRKVLCENNRYSRDLEDGKTKIMVPVLSLGMSWLSGRLVKSVNPATSMLDSLKASILGLGKASCDGLYQSCDLVQLKEESRRRRRKRNVRRD